MEEEWNDSRVHGYRPAAVSAGSLAGLRSARARPRTGPLCSSTLPSAWSRSINCSFPATGEKVGAYVAEESQDIWLVQAKRTVDAFEIQEVTVAPGGQRADVTVMITYRIPQAPGAPFRQPQKTEWLYQGGEWFVRLKPLGFFDGLVQQGQRRV